MKISQQLLLTFVFLMIITNSYSSSEGKTNDLEKSVCGLKEAFHFWLWSSMAGTSRDPNQVVTNKVKSVSFLTSDGRMLRGYQYHADKTYGIGMQKVKGFLLVLQGNAILAEQIIHEFLNFSQAGYDVYVFDYRGYGRSEGKRRLKAIVSDVGQIITYLGDRNYTDNIIYAMSFGGIVLLDAKYNFNIVNRVVIDSTPSRLSDYGCPEEYDPIENLPTSCKNYLFITGRRDPVVKPAMSTDLTERAKQCGATHILNDEYSHPFMDSAYRTHMERMKTIENYLLNKKG